MKKLFALTTLVFMLGSVIYAAEPILGNTISYGTTNEGFQLEGNALKPLTDDQEDLGSSSLEWQDGFFDGTLTTDVLAVDETTTHTRSVTITGDLLESVTTITQTSLGTDTGNDVTLTTAQGGYIICSASSAITLDLPAVSGNAGLKYVVVRNTNTVAQQNVTSITLDGSSSETIGGVTTNNDTDNWFDVIAIVCDGDEWHILNQINN